MSRRAHRRFGTAKWHITVATSDNTEVLFHGTTPDRDEIEELCQAARELRPEALIWLRSPTGHVTSWD
jgi:hypothetical protein